jgi:hypothetical protein
MTQNKTNNRPPRCYTITHGGMKAQMTIWLICQGLNTNLHDTDGQSNSYGTKAGI